MKRARTQTRSCEDNKERIRRVSMSHRVTDVHVSTCGQVSVNHQQLLLITGLPEVVLVHIIRLRDIVSHGSHDRAAMSSCPVSDEDDGDVCVLPLCGQQGELQVSRLQLSALSWSSSAAEGSGGQQASPGRDDPIYLSELGQEDHL